MTLPLTASRQRKSLRRGPVTPVRRERGRPGKPARVDVKKVARIPEGGGWRARGASTLTHPGSGAGYACPHVTVDDRSRAACAELLPDEQKGAASPSSEGWAPAWSA